MSKQKKKEKESLNSKEIVEKTDPVSEFKETLKQVEKYGLSEEDRALLAKDTGSWPSHVQLLVSAYIKHLFYNNAVMHKSLEALASGIITGDEAIEFAQGALELTSLRNWRNIPNAKNDESKEDRGES